MCQYSATNCICIIGSMWTVFFCTTIKPKKYCLKHKTFVENQVIVFLKGVMILQSTLFQWVLQVLVLVGRPGCIQAAVPLMSTRIRQVSNGGLHLQSQQYQQRGDLALTSLMGPPATQTFTTIHLHAEAPPTSITPWHREADNSQWTAGGSRAPVGQDGSQEVCIY